MHSPHIKLPKTVRCRQTHAGQRRSMQASEGLCRPTKVIARIYSLSVVCCNYKFKPCQICKFMQASVGQSIKPADL
ncbi:hypothetical protein K440DRAFT_271685 [Wilcoxina mikolae CBS 423.85]|nr:hypothetical protein K440DRAFT_271685 [Wilcoxina mikolae CBS 423.85]